MPAAELRAGVVGAGLGGAMAALYLARRGHQVEVFELRGDLRRDHHPGPSMNLGLSRRGIAALERLGLADAILGLTIPMAGRIIHDLDGGIAFQPYGRGPGQVIHAIGRNDINAALLDAAESSAKVRISFNHRFVGFADGECRLRDEARGAEVRVRADFWVGADGAFSAVRRAIQRDQRADFQQEFLDWGWKEIRVPAGPGGKPLLEKNAFHLWPRGGCMLFAHPNQDGSFTCSLVLPFQGPRSLESLADEARAAEFFAALFPDLVALVPDLTTQFLHNPVVPLVTIRTSPWHSRGQVVLLGDSAHAVVPFLAQGMNAAFEDCAVLDQCLERSSGDLTAAFAAYQALRKPNTDALAAMSKQNFLELRDTVRSPWLRARRKLDFAVGKVKPGWVPLHARVTNTCTPYAEALAQARRQDRVLGWLAAALLLAGAAALAAGLAAWWR